MGADDSRKKCVLYLVLCGVLCLALLACTTMTLLLPIPISAVPLTGRLLSGDQWFMFSSISSRGRSPALPFSWKAPVGLDQCWHSRTWPVARWNIVQSPIFSL